MNYITLGLATLLTFYASTGSCAEDDGTSVSTAASTPNAAVVESDHGEGLGPNGADLHVNPEAENRDAEILQNSLQTFPELKAAELKAPELNTPEMQATEPAEIPAENITKPNTPKPIKPGANE